MKKDIIITIGREFGSGGREIGQRIAERLGIPFFDKELLVKAAKDSGIAAERFVEHDELLRPVYTPMAIINNERWEDDFFQFYGYFSNDGVARAQFRTMHNVAKENPSCVIIGRCADYILQNYPQVLSIFIYADMDARVERIMKLHNLNEKKAKQLIKKMDKQRANYYNFYTDQKWNDMCHYDLCVNSTPLGVEGTVNAICNYIAIVQENMENTPEE
jgi:cytidylate kinase